MTEMGLLFMKKLDNFIKALENLRTVQEIEPPYTVMNTAGSVALFEICFEQAWKAMKEALTENGYSESKIGSPRQIIKLAFGAGMINKQEEWLKMLTSRNDVAHSYNEEIALEIIAAVKGEYISLFDDLRDELLENWQ